MIRTPSNVKLVLLLLWLALSVAFSPPFSIPSWKPMERLSCRRSAPRNAMKLAVEMKKGTNDGVHPRTQLSSLNYTVNVFLAMLYSIFTIPFANLLRRVGILARQEYAFEDMRGKVVVVTGASSGVGKCTTASLHAAGATVVMGCRSRERGERAKEEILRDWERLQERGRSRMVCNVGLPICHGGRLIVKEVDTSDYESVRRFSEEVRESFEEVNALVNNAGTNGKDEKTPALSRQGREYIFETNFVGHFLLTLCLEGLLRRGRGRIVNLSSVMHHWGARDVTASLRSGARRSSYRDSKLAMLHLTAEINRRWGGAVSAIAVNPGFVSSDIWRGMSRAGVRGWLFDVFLSFLALRPVEGCATTVVAVAMREEDKEEERMGMKGEETRNEEGRGRPAAGMEGSRRGEMLYLVPYALPAGVRLPFEIMGPYMCKEQGEMKQGFDFDNRSEDCNPEGSSWRRVDWDEMEDRAGERVGKRRRKLGS
eukprot:763390-Hanusia_phi.AAC.2